MRSAVSRRTQPQPDQRPSAPAARAVLASRNQLERSHPLSINKAAPDETLALYRQLLLIRRFEEMIQSLFQKGEVQGSTHLYAGQGAVAVGVAQRQVQNTRTVTPQHTINA
jgi:TPP-dependent pyruvate/acetoin dehydrogenase alpha subunit